MKRGTERYTLSFIVPAGQHCWIGTTMAEQGLLLILTCSEDEKINSGRKKSIYLKMKRR